MPSPPPTEAPTPHRAGKGERAFYFVLAAAVAPALWLTRPYFAALVLAVVVVVVIWPLHLRTVRALRGRRRLATFVTLSALTLGLFAPTLGLAWMATGEVAQISREISSSLSEESGVSRLNVALDAERTRTLSSRITGDPETFKRSAQGALNGAATQALGGVRAVTTNLVNLTTAAVINLVVFYMTAASLLVAGAESVRWLKHISPLEDAHEEKLFSVFTELSRNVLLAGVVGGLVQGAIAGGGYAIVGFDRWAVYGVLTGALSIVPVLGGAIVWVPLVVALLIGGQIWQAVFLVVWSIGLTSTADNLLKPLLVRGDTKVPTLFVVLGVFGGLAWLGPVGALIGPVILAFVRALLTIYEEGYLQADGPELQPTRAEPPSQSGGEPASP